MVIFSIVFALGSELPVGDQDLEALKKPSIRVVAVANNSPAEKAGIKIGDTLLQVDGVALDKVKDFKELTQSNAGKNINIKIGRNNGEFSVSLSPRENPPAGEGAVGLALERMATLIEKTPWYLAPIEGIKYTWKITVDSLVGLYTMLSDLVLRKGLPQEAAFAGPVGITVFLANAAGLGISFFLYIVGVISVAVAIFNLFPIPALDGGKLVFLLIEKIKGRPVSVRIEQSITLICFAILIILSLFVTVKFDIPRITEFFKAL
jgi:regulator of sigma E protease